MGRCGWRGGCRDRKVLSGDVRSVKKDLRDELIV